MDGRQHESINSRLTEAEAISRETHEKLYEDAWPIGRSHRHETRFLLETLERDINRAHSGDKPVAAIETSRDAGNAVAPLERSDASAKVTPAIESSHTDAELNDRASTVLDLFDSLDKDHNGRLDKNEIAEGLANFKGHPQEEQALLLLQRNYDLIHRLADPMNFRVGISKDNLTQLRNLERGEFSLKDEIAYNYVRGWNTCLGAGTLGATVTGFTEAGPLGAAGGFAFGVAVTLAADYLALPAMVAIDYSWLNRNKIETFLKDVPAAGCKPKGWLEAAEKDSNDDVR